MNCERGRVFEIHVNDLSRNLRITCRPCLLKDVNSLKCMSATISNHLWCDVFANGSAWAERHEISRRDTVEAVETWE